MNIIISNFQDKRRGIVILMWTFFDRQIEMEPRVIDWAKEKAKMTKIVRKIHVYC